MKNVFKMALIVSSVFVFGCATTDNEPTEWDLGDEVNAPYGCELLKKENPNADC